MSFARTCWQCGHHFSEKPHAVLVGSTGTKPIFVAHATPEKIDAARVTLRSISEGRNHEIFLTGLNLSRLGLSPTEVEAEAELITVVGSEPHMRKKVPEIIKSLGRVWTPVGGEI